MRPKTLWNSSKQAYTALNEITTSKPHLQNNFCQSDCWSKKTPPSIALTYTHTRLYNLSQRRKFTKFICSLTESGELPSQVLCILCSPAQKPTWGTCKSNSMHCTTRLWWPQQMWYFVRHKQNPIEYTHHELPYGKDWHGSSLQQALQDLFSEYASPTVAWKLAPCLDSRRNESLNGTIGSKNLKVRHYGGSENDDFRTACTVAQYNEGHNFVCKTLIETGINPGPHCTSYQQKQDHKVSSDKQNQAKAAWLKQVSVDGQKRKQGRN